MSYSEPPMYGTGEPMMDEGEDDSEDEEEDDEEEEDDMVFDTGAPVMAGPTVAPSGMPMMWPVSA